MTIESFYTTFFNFNNNNRDISAMQELIDFWLCKILQEF